MHTHKHRASETSDTDQHPQHPREWTTGLTLTWTSKNSAPKDSTCSLTAARVSKARTTAPMFLAVPMADRPATPPPMINTLAGGTLPAAVIWPVDNPGITLHHKVTKCSVQSRFKHENITLEPSSPPPTLTLARKPGRYLHHGQQLWRLHKRRLTFLWSTSGEAMPWLNCWTWRPFVHYIT